jgi:hypothetical protein
MGHNSPTMIFGGRWYPILTRVLAYAKMDLHADLQVVSATGGSEIAMPSWPMIEY